MVPRKWSERAGIRRFPAAQGVPQVLAKSGKLSSEGTFLAHGSHPRAPQSRRAARTPTGRHGMNWLFLIGGIVLILIVFIDALWTTLWVESGAGPLARKSSNWIWRGGLSVIGRERHRRLSLLGPLILFFTLIMWIVLLWAGWVLVFAGGSQSLAHAHTGAPADWAARIYFVGYMMFTAGNGDFSPSGGGWQIAAALTNATGMVVVTLALTYLISIVSAVVKKRGFASGVMGLGISPDDFVASGWNGRDFRSLDLPLAGMAATLSDLAQRYEAYPILQYYHAGRVAKSPILAAATLDDALSILSFAVPESLRPAPAVLKSARAAVESFLETMPSAFISKADEAPAPPELRALRHKGVPLLSEEDFRAGLAGISERRCRLLGLVRNDGWEWAEHRE